MKKRDDGRYRRSFTVDGQRYYVYGYNKKELDKNEEEKRLQIVLGNVKKSGKDNEKWDFENQTLDQYHEIWENDMIEVVKGSTIRSNSCRYNACADVFIERTGVRLGRMKLKEITVDDIREVQRELKNGKRTTETVNNAIAHLSHIFHTAVIERKLEYNPCLPIKNLRRKEPEARDTIHRALTDEELDAFFDETKRRGSFYYDVYRFALATGLRIGEIGALTYADIHDGFINVSKTVTKDRFGKPIVGESAKTKYGERQIPLNESITEIIEHQKDINTMLDGEISSEEELIFKAPERGLLVVFPVDRELTRICNKIGIERFTMHAFRATFATQMIEAGVNPRILQALMGHAHYDLTMSLYGHAMDDSKIEAMKTFESWFSEKK